MNYVQPALEEGQYYSVHANQEKIVGNDATKGGTIYMYCANKHGEGDSAGFRYKFIDEAGQPIGEARTASLTEWVRVASDYLLKPCDMMPVTPSDIKTNSAVKATMISSKVSAIIAAAAATRLQTAAAKGVQTAAPLPEEAYQWFVHGGKTLKMENKNKTLVLNKGSTYGVRFSANKKFIRLVTKDKPTVVYTLTADTAKVLGKTAKPAGNKDNVAAVAEAFTSSGFTAVSARTAGTEIVVTGKTALGPYEIRFGKDRDGDATVVSYMSAGVDAPVEEDYLHGRGPEHIEFLDDLKSIPKISNDRVASVRKYIGALNDYLGISINYANALVKVAKILK